MTRQNAIQTQQQASSASPLSRGGILQRKCESCGQHTIAGGECGDCGKTRLPLQRRATEQSDLGEVPPIVHEVLNSPGQSLDPETRTFMESRFKQDFSQVRVHTDAKAAESAQALGALAYVVGRDIFFEHGQHDPKSLAGRWTLAHELTHVLQQSGRSILSGQNIRVGATERYEQQADAVATDLVNGRQLTSVTAGTTASIMLLTPKQFRTKLGSTPAQESSIDALFANVQFNGLWNYLSACLAKPKQDLGPLALKVTPGLKIGGVERFGGYNPMTRTLEINPNKPEHQANPQELIDTVVHELIHAEDDLDEDCVKAGASASPLKGAGTEQSAPPLADVKGTSKEDDFLRELGPGASNPCEEFIDINKKAQQIIVAIIQSNIKTTKIGRPTLTFVNDALRNSPAALADYKTCRDAACAKKDLTDRTTAIGKCGEEIIAKYVTPPPKVSTPAPAPGVFPPSPPPPKMSPKKQKNP